MATKPTITVNWAPSGTATYPAGAVSNTGYQNEEELPAEEFNGIIQALGDWTIFLDSIFGNGVSLSLDPASATNNARIEFDSEAGTETRYRFTNDTNEARWFADILEADSFLKAPFLELTNATSVYIKLGSSLELEESVSNLAKSGDIIDGVALSKIGGNESSFSVDILDITRSGTGPIIYFDGLTGFETSEIRIAERSASVFELDFRDSTVSRDTKLSLDTINLRGDTSDRVLTVNDSDVVATVDTSSSVANELDFAAGPKNVVLSSDAVLVKASGSIADAGTPYGHTRLLTSANLVKAVVQIKIATGLQSADGSCDESVILIPEFNYNVDIAASGLVTSAPATGTQRPGEALGVLNEAEVIEIVLEDALVNSTSSLGSGAVVTGVNIAIDGHPGTVNSGNIPVRGRVIQQQNGIFSVILESFIQYGSTIPQGWYPTFGTETGRVYGTGGGTGFSKRAILDGTTTYIVSFIILEA